MVYNDALAIENAAKIYCASSTVGCDPTEELTWDDLSEYVSDIDENDYDFTANNNIIAEQFDSEWKIYMERSGIGDWEFPQGMIPSTSSSDDCIIDVD